MRLYLLFIMCLLFTAQWSYAQNPTLESAIEAFNKKDFLSSKKQLISLIKTDKKKAIYWFNLGHVFASLRSHPKAMKCYERVITLQSPLAPAARFYQAKILVNEGQLEAAQSQLELNLTSQIIPMNLRSMSEDLLASISTPSNIEELSLKRYQAEDYLSSLNILKSVPEQSLSDNGRLLLMMIYTRTNNWKDFEKLKRQYFRSGRVSTARRSLILDLEKNFSNGKTQSKPLTLFLDLSAGNNSNVYAEGKSVDPLESFESRLFLGGTYQWGLGKDEFFRAGYTFFKNSFKEAEALNSYTHNIRTSYIKTDGTSAFEITPYFQIQNWDGVNVSNRVGANVVSSRGFASGEYGVIGDFSKRSSLNADYTYLDSYSSNTRFYLSLWTSSLYFELNGSAGYDGTKDIVYSDGGRLPLTHIFYGPGIRSIWRMSDQWQMTGQGSYFLRNYLNTALPNDKIRSDRELSYSLRLNYYFVQSTSVYLQYEGLQNGSNLGTNDVRDKNYNVSTQFLGITWDFL